MLAQPQKGGKLFHLVAVLAAGAEPVEQFGGLGIAILADVNPRQPEQGLLVVGVALERREIQAQRLSGIGLLQVRAALSISLRFGGTDLIEKLANLILG